MMLSLQETCADSTTAYGAYTIRPRIVGTKEQVDPGFERAEEQVEEPFHHLPPRFFLEAAATAPAGPLEC